MTLLSKITRLLLHNCLGNQQIKFYVEKNISFFPILRFLTFLIMFTNIPIFGQNVEPSITLTLDSSQIYEGESTQLIVSILNGKPDSEPDYSNLEQNFVVVPLGASTRSSVQISYENGVPKRIETQGIDYRFQLTPQKAGVISIETPRITVKGKSVVGSPVVLTIKPSTKTDLVLLESSVTPIDAKIYPLVPFEISVDILLQEAPEKYNSIDILKLITEQLGAPQLTIPWLQSRSISTKTISDLSLEEWLNKFHNKYGFVLNNFQLSNSPFDFGFSFFDNPRSTLFLPESEEIERTNANGTPIKYRKYTFKRKLRAQEPGTLVFGPCSLKGNFIDFSEQENPKSTSVFLSTPTFSVEIKEIPETEAPNNYVGIYGNVSQLVEVSTRNIAVGDVLTLSIAFHGYGSFDNVRAPNLNDFLKTEDSFKIYEASERSLEDGVAFDYKLRPLKDGVHKIPSIQTSYFDVEQGKFVQNSSEPIDITVRKGLLAQDEEEHYDASSSDQKSINPLAQHIKKQQKVFKYILQLTVWVGICVFLVFTYYVLKKVSSWNANRIALSNKRIIEVAQSMLEKGLAIIETSPNEGVQQLRLAFIQLIRNRFPQSPDTLTDAEIVAFFDKEIDKSRSSSQTFNLTKLDKVTQVEGIETLKKIQKFFQSAEQIRFGGVIIVNKNFNTEVRELFQRWIKFLMSQTKKLTIYSGSTR